MPARARRSRKVARSAWDWPWVWARYLPGRDIVLPHICDMPLSMTGSLSTPMPQGRSRKPPRDQRQPCAGPVTASDVERLLEAGVSAFGDYQSGGRGDVLDAAVSAFLAAVAAATAGDPDYAVCQLSLGGCLLVRFERTGNTADLDAAIDAGRKAVAAAPPGHAHRAAALSNLSASLLARYELAGSREDLDAAIDAGRQSAAAIPPGHPDWATCMSNLSASLLARYEVAGSREDLDAAIDAGRQSADAVPQGHPDRAALVSTLGNCLLRQFQIGQGAEPDEVVAAFRDAVAATEPGHPNRGMYLSNLGVALRARFERAGEGADLDAAVDAGRAAIGAIPPGHPDLAAMLSNLATSLCRRFERTGDGADLDAAVDAGRAAADATPPGHPELARRLSNLTAFLSRRFERTGDEADLDAAIDAGRRAANATPPGHTELAGRLSNLSASLLTRFDRMGDRADLDAAVDAGRAAAQAMPRDHPDRCTVLSNLGTSLFRRFQSGQADDLDAAVTALQDALAAAGPGHHDRAMCLLNLSASLRDRFEQAGDPADLDAAIDFGQQAVDATPPGRPGLTSYLSSLAVTFFTRFGVTGDRADLDAAIATGRRAVDGTPPGDASLAGRLASLGTFFSRRLDRYADPADLDAAIGCWRRAIRERTGAPGMRLGAARSWGSAAARAGRWHDAAEGYAAAVDLLPTAAWHGLDRSTRERQLAQWAGLAADAGACSVLDRHPERAVELLEQGRSVLWNQGLNLRSDLTRLSSEHPDMARRLDHLRRILDTPAPGYPPGAPEQAGGIVTGTSRDREDAAELRRRAAREWDETLAQVRALRGFGRFLAATPYTELAAAVEGGPVVILNASRHSCDALIVEPGSKQPQVVHLPAVTANAAADHANAMLAALAGAYGQNWTIRGLSSARHAILDVLGWLWDAIAEPVLTALGHDAPPGPAELWPRVWWSPTGPLSVLPIHAAGHYPRELTAVTEEGNSVLDCVVSSYTPTINALTRARQPPPSFPVRHLAVGMPATPGMASLPSVRTELEVLARHFPPSGGHHQLIGPQATQAAVQAALRTHSWVHFACHAGQLHADPGLSGFALWDATLTITDLAAQPTELRDLAFLSACQTAAGSLRHLDEAIHLAAAMQFVGYRHVIATRWIITDRPAHQITDSVYAALTTGGTHQATAAAQALHYAVQVLRRTYPADPLRWAPFIHLGP